MLKQKVGPTSSPTTSETVPTIALGPAEQNLATALSTVGLVVVPFCLPVSSTTSHISINVGVDLNFAFILAGFL